MASSSCCVFGRPAAPSTRAHVPLSRAHATAHDVVDGTRSQMDGVSARDTRARDKRAVPEKIRLICLKNKGLFISLVSARLELATSGTGVSHFKKAGL